MALQQAILFKRCLGFSDARTFGTLKMVTNPDDPEAGSVELKDCLNMTTTPDGCIEKIPAFTSVLTHSATITNISADKRFLYQDGIDIKEWDGTNIYTRFPIIEGAIAHTPIDCRVSGEDEVVYKSANASPVMDVAGVGINPNPETAIVFDGMPLFKQAFEYNGVLYAVNLEDPNHLQYSEDYHFDLWNIGDNFIGHASEILQAGAIHGCIVLTHSNGISVYVGNNKSDFVSKFYPCTVIDKTLYSGYVPRLDRYSHVFLCNDGVYAVTPDGIMANITVGSIDNIDSLNASYTCATVDNGKYLAFGNTICIEYDFITKTVLKRNSFDVVSAAVWNGRTYYAIGTDIVELDTEIDATDDFVSSFTLPYSDFGVSGAKSIEALYFTGTIDGDIIISLIDQNEKGWELDTSMELVNVSNYRIKTPKGILGNHISVKMECLSGTFRVEELRVAFATSKRNK